MYNKITQNETEQNKREREKRERQREREREEREEREGLGWETIDQSNQSVKQTKQCVPAGCSSLSLGVNFFRSLSSPKLERNDKVSSKRMFTDMTRVSVK
jgi:hypothetical protein